MNEIGSPFGREMTWWEQRVDRARRLLSRFRRKLPYLVWYGDELDVTVRFAENKLIPTPVVGNALGQLYSGSMRQIETALHDAGVSFDSGIGMDGRDWEWDFSLSGPISIMFRGRASRPERRTARPKPRLVVSNDAA